VFHSVGHVLAWLSSGLQADRSGARFASMLTSDLISISLLLYGLRPQFGPVNRHGQSPATDGQVVSLIRPTEGIYPCACPVGIADVQLKAHAVVVPQVRLRCQRPTRT
jgi:hypothetical protein